MRVVIASDADGMSMKESIKEMLIADGHEVVDYSETPAADFVDSATAVARTCWSTRIPGLRIR